MGRLRRSRTHHARRDVHRAARTRVRTKDLDQIEMDLRPTNRGKLEKQPIDEDKPGLGQHYCVECAKYYESDLALKNHTKSKVHRRRLKDLKEPAYTIGESERAAGLGSDDKQKGVDDVIKKFEGFSGAAESSTAQQ
ncbi:bud site selection protein 20 [Cryptococcus wingfieldii CBS 7118]|uniref:Bud site selection protein 20 n=1 Tax=Cryptococcus wingfieldii CBS 7118 TaxID=1295528 RepID=A0A1E3K392_9TREE|nr:bud site selection protein 20 [Cryptococcus wingfieldii CBS 7118]ODO07584.1 bud site selection protein 20 [Cryptococcus wingfieldii CBS 7118]